MKQLFEGIGTAIITPFEENGMINYTCLAQLIQRQEKAGVRALIVNGTTSENATLSEEEQVELITFAATHCAPQTQVIAGVSSNSTAKLAKLAAQITQLDIDGLLVLTPYYNRANDLGMIAHFEAVLAVTHLPIILYHIPGRTGCGISRCVLERLTQYPQVQGIKYADDDYQFAMEIMRDFSSDTFYFYSGNDDMNLALIALGAKGVISAAANVIPEALVQLYAALGEGNLVLARAIHFRYLALIHLLFMETNPIMIKHALRCMGFDVGGYRLPLCAPIQSSQEAFAELALTLPDLFPTLQQIDEQ